MADEIYVLILDSDKNNPTHWEYVVERKTRSEIDSVTCYSSKDRQTRSKRDFDGTFLERKQVECNETHDKANGTTCVLTKREMKEAMSFKE